MARRWEIEKLDLDAYLDRIGHPRVDPSADALHTLHATHIRTIPFENVDVILGTHPGLGLDAVQAKLVRRSRGGYCYEHALLFGAALERLGFQVTRRVARVQPHKSGPRTHALLEVEVDDQEFLTDVGFGAGVLHSVPLKDGAVVDQAGWDHRITFDEGYWILSKQTADGWTPLHASGDEPQRPIDYEVYHHYVSTHPDSPFSGKLVVIRLSDGLVRRLVGDELTTEHADGRIEQCPVTADSLALVSARSTWSSPTRNWTGSCSRGTGPVRDGSAPGEPFAGHHGYVSTSEGRELAAWARMLADPTRATVCLALLDGRAWTAGDLARLAEVSRPTMTEHLNLLVAAGLLTEVRSGRSRYVEIADERIAETIENLASLAPVPAPEPANGLTAVTKREAFRRARTCYDHFAGIFGVAIADAMTTRGYLDWTDGIALTPAGTAWLTEHRIEIPDRRTRIRFCIDVTERRPHVAGAVGAALCAHALDHGLAHRIRGTRAVRPTTRIRELGLGDLL